MGDRLGKIDRKNGRLKDKPYGSLIFLLSQIERQIERKFDRNNDRKIERMIYRQKE